MITLEKREEILEATRGLDEDAAMMVARAMGNDDAVQEKIQKYKDEIENLQQVLGDIYSHGSHKQDAGLACAMMAYDALSDSTQRLQL